MTTVCKHPPQSLIPYEYEFGQKVYDSEYKKWKYNWYSVSSQAHIVRMKSMYCLKCNKVIPIHDPR